MEGNVLREQIAARCCTFGRDSLVVGDSVPMRDNITAGCITAGGGGKVIGDRTAMRDNTTAGGSARKRDSENIQGDPLELK